MGMTMTSKILSKASGNERVEAGDTVLAKLNLMACEDALVFYNLFKKYNLKVWDPKKIVICIDHCFQHEWLVYNVLEEHPKIRQFVKDQGIPQENLYDFGRQGISHQVPVEEGWVLPGTVSIGVDTMSATMGAANTFAMPALETGAGPMTMTGDMWIMVPECVQICLTGKLHEGVTGRDLVFALMNKLKNTVNGKVLEFTGSGISTLSIDTRMSICNGASQIGALTAIFPADAMLLDYLKGRARDPFEPVASDEDADYTDTFNYDLGSTGFMLAGPHNLETIRPLEELLGQEIEVAYVGSCPSGRLSDLELTARILRGRKVAPGVRLFVTPESSRIMREAVRAGYIQDIVDAGATVTTPGCGACYVGNLSPLKLGPGERCIATAVENMPGRMGSPEAEILLGGTAVAAAAAIEGRLSDPKKYLIG